MVIPALIIPLGCTPTCSKMCYIYTHYDSDFRMKNLEVAFQSWASVGAHLVSCECNKMAIDFPRRVYISVHSCVILFISIFSLCYSVCCRLSVYIYIFHLYYTFQSFSVLSVVLHRQATANSLNVKRILNLISAWCMLYSISMECWLAAKLQWNQNVGEETIVTCNTSFWWEKNRLLHKAPHTLNCQWWLSAAHFWCACVMKSCGRRSVSVTCCHPSECKWLLDHGMIRGMKGETNWSIWDN